MFNLFGSKNDAGFVSENSSQLAGKKKILLSGVKSTGRPHIANYFAVMKQYVDLQGEGYDSRIFIADLHSLTSVQNGPELAQSTLDLAIDYLAIGVDPKHVTIFKQSDLPEVAELAWIFSCITTMPYLMRAHAFKDAEAKNKEISVGVFEYPMLMAADIIIHNADVVPVGKDQKQHVEIARDTADKFNRIFCGDGKTYDEDHAIFKLPTEMIKAEVETIPGIDGQKMSKSYGNHIPLFAEDDEITKLVMSIVTDSGAANASGNSVGVVNTPGNTSGPTSAAPIPVNVFNIHKLLLGDKNLIASGKTYLENENSLKKFYESTEGKYKPLKDALVADLIAFIKPLREKRAEIAKDPDKIRTMLARNGELMREKTHPLVQRVRKATGLIV